jgi:hypothetical protein
MELGPCLGAALVKYPALYEDLPVLITALDAGKQVVLDENSSDPLQQIIVRILHVLPTVCSRGAVWAKGDCRSLRDFILSTLLTSKMVVQPQEMTQHERLAVKSCQELVRIFETNVEILPDLISLLDNLLDGEGVDLSGLDNLTLRDQLTSFFAALEILSGEDGVFQLSEDRNSQKAIKSILLSLQLELPQVTQTLEPDTDATTV